MEKALSMTNSAKESQADVATESARKAWIAPSLTRLRAGAAELAIGDDPDGIGDES